MTNDYFDVIFVKEHPNDIIECFIIDKIHHTSPTRAFYKEGDADTFIEPFDGAGVYFSTHFLSLLFSL